MIMKKVKILLIGAGLWAVTNGLTTAGTTNEPGLVAYWPFDEGCGNVINDASGNGNKGIVYGAMWTTNNNGTDLKFEGSCAMVSNSPVLSGMNELTITAWVKAERVGDGNGNMSIIEKFDEAEITHISYIIRIGLDGSGLPVFLFQRHSSCGSMADLGRIDGKTVIQAGRWYHVVAVSDGNCLKLYVDGKSDAKSFPLKGGIGISKTPLFIGCSYGSRYFFNGVLAEIKIYNRSLSEDEIRSQYDKGRRTCVSSGNTNYITAGLKSSNDEENNSPARTNIQGALTSAMPPTNDQSIQAAPSGSHNTERAMPGNETGFSRSRASISATIRRSISGGMANILKRCGFAAGNKYAIPEDWRPIKKLGKDFWFIFVPGAWDNPGVRNESFLKNAGARVHVSLKKSPEISFPDSIGPEPCSRRIVVREIEVFNSNSCNLARETKVAGNCRGGFCEPEKAVDGDQNSFGLSKDAFFDSISGDIELRFPNKVNINTLKIYHGYKRFNNDKNPWQVIPGLKLQYWNGSSWLNVSGAELKDNESAENTFIFNPLETDKIKILIHIPAVADGKKEYFSAQRPFFLYDYTLRFDMCGDSLLNKAVNYKRYDEWKKIYKDGFLGFWFPEWENDINHLYRWIGGDPFRLPKTRKEACELFEKTYKKQRKICFDDIWGMGGGFNFDHYNLEWGGNLTGLELSGCSDGRALYNIQTAFCRGAARQYHKQWYKYDAYFYLGAHPDFLTPCRSVIKEAPNPSGPNCGIPFSLARRSLYHAYYAGANYLDFEEQPQGFVQDKNGDGVYELSPFGEILKDFFDFSQKHPDRGVPYTPIALLLDYYHGWTPVTEPSVWCNLPYADGDHMISGVMKTIFPYRGLVPRRIGDKPSENCIGLVNTPYGDIYDVLMVNPPSGAVSMDTIDNYKAFFLLGDIRMDKTLADSLMKYVQAGGTLLINSKQVKGDFPENFLGVKLLDAMDDGSSSSSKVELLGATPFIMDTANNPIATINKYGQGRLILTLPSYLIKKDNKSPLALVSQMLSFLVKETLPVEITGDIAWQLNRTESGWILVLMNNKGVVKDKFTLEEFDPRKTADVRIKFKGKIKEITELMRDAHILFQRKDGNTLLGVKVLPGDMQVLKLIE